MGAFTEDWYREHQARVNGARPALRVVETLPQPKPRAKMKRPEQELQIDAIEFLRVALPPDWRVFHVPNGGARSEAEAAILKAMGVWPGVGDLAFVGRGGRFVGAEAKAGRNGLTDGQEEWRDWCFANDIPWFVFRSIDELIAGCTDAGIPLRVRA